MPKGPQGQKRPADVIGCAVLVAQIAIGEALETHIKLDGHSFGGVDRSKKLTPKECSAITKKAANSRWKNDA